MIRVTVTKDGRCHRRGRELAADELDAAVDEYARKCRTRGWPGFFEGGPGVEYSRLHLLLRVDRETPWRAVADVLRRAEDARIVRVAFQALVRDSWGSLAELDAPRSAAPDPRCVVVDASDDPEALRRALQRADRDARLAGGIAPAPGRPFEHVLRLLEVFAEYGVDRVYFR